MRGPGDTGPAPGVSVSAHDGPVIPDVLLPPPGPLSLSSPCLGRDLTGNSQPQLPANSRTGRITSTVQSDYYRLLQITLAESENIIELLVKPESSSRVV